MSGEEYLIQSRLHLEEDVSGSMYSLNPLRSGAMRVHAFHVCSPASTFLGASSNLFYSERERERGIESPCL